MWRRWDSRPSEAQRSDSTPRGIRASRHPDRELAHPLAVARDRCDQQRTPVVQVPRDGWHRWEVHAKFSTIAGFAEVSIDGNVVLPVHTRRTMVAGEPDNYFKCGLYESSAETATRVVWHDNLAWSKAV